MENQQPALADPFADLMLDIEPGRSMWLRYSLITGAARTGTLTDQAIAIVLRDASLDNGWTHVLGLGDGRLAFYSGATRMLTIGRVDLDGVYGDLKNNPNAESAHNVVAVFHDMLLFYTVRSGSNGYSGIAVTGRVATDGTYTRLSEPYFFDFWTHIVPAQDGLVFFYNSYSRLAATGRVTGDGGFADLQTHPDFDEWTDIVAATDGTLLFYHRTTGAAASGRVQPDGGFTNLRSAALGPGLSLRATLDNRMLISRPADTLVATFPRDGWFFDARIVNGLILPMPTLFVR